MQMLNLAVAGGEAPMAQRAAAPLEPASSRLQPSPMDSDDRDEQDRSRRVLTRLTNMGTLRNTAS
jgi:hypothetical protein